MTIKKEIKDKYFGLKNAKPPCETRKTMVSHAKPPCETMVSRTEKPWFLELNCETTLRNHGFSVVSRGGFTWFLGFLVGFSMVSRWFLTNFGLRKKKNSII